MPIIPKKIHFIWVGGSKLPAKYIENICAWTERNPSFEVTVWVDHKTADPRYFEEYRKDFYEGVKKTISAGGGTDADISARAEDISKRIKFLDIENIASFSGEVKEIVRYVIDRSEPNYGMASDFLRYLILYNYGGAYFDTDVKPPLKGSLEELTKVFGVDHKNERLYCRSRMATGSDVLACTPHVVIMKEMLDCAIKNYTLHVLDEVFICDTYCFHPLHVKDRAIYLSGPDLLFKICENSKAVSGLYDEGFNIKMDSDCSWVGCWSPLSNLDLAIERAVSCIAFEVKYLGKLLLDYHVGAIIESLRLGGMSVSADEIIPLLLQKVAEKLTPEFRENIKLTQLTFKYPETVEFYKKYDLSAKTGFLLASESEKITPEKANSMLDTLLSIFFAMQGLPFYVHNAVAPDKINALIFAKGLFSMYGEYLRAVGHNPAATKILMDIVTKFWQQAGCEPKSSGGIADDALAAQKKAWSEAQAEFLKIREHYGEKKSIGADIPSERRVGDDPRMFASATVVVKPADVVSANLNFIG